MTTYRELLLGCGAKRIKDARLPTARDIRAGVQTGEGDAFEGLTTLDINPDHKPDILFNLERIDGEACNRIPFYNGLAPKTNGKHPCPDNWYDEIHAYEVLEHIGRQGDYRKFFDQFTEFWRILKPDGLFFATVPSWHSSWAWGDPSHTRVITLGTLAFLSQQQYRNQVGVTPMSDFRWCYKADFVCLYADDSSDSTVFVLRAVK